MKEIRLTQGQVALVDDEDFELVNQYKWHAMWKDSSGYYARRSFRENGGIKSEYMHHLIMGSREQLDHIDHNGLNNQKGNLRICNNSQNQANTEKRSNMLSKYKGVTKSFNGENWVAQIKKDNHSEYIGTYSNEEAAAKAYDQKAFSYWGEFAITNFSIQDSYDDLKNYSIKKSGRKPLLSKETYEKLFSQRNI